MSFLAPRGIIGINRHRINSDGNGITTLVGFYGCPLNCKYCLNPECHSVSAITETLTPQQLLDELKVDDLYFRSTNGGITFGGGEPLLYPQFIKKFKEAAPAYWQIRVETSLNVPLIDLEMCADDINQFIIDIKDVSNKVYMGYTKKSNRKVLQNLKWLIDHKSTDKIIVKVPEIPGFNNDKDIENSTQYLQGLGITHIECTIYHDTSEINGLKKPDAHVGKEKCNVLKEIRKMIANNNGLVYSPENCSYQGSCSGTCPKCENELKTLITYIKTLEDNGQQVKF